MKCIGDSGEVASSLVWPARLSSTLFEEIIMYTVEEFYGLFNGDDD
jgi:hypothetical protein